MWVLCRDSEHSSCWASSPAPRFGIVRDKCCSPPCLCNLFQGHSYTKQRGYFLLLEPYWPQADDLHSGKSQQTNQQKLGYAKKRTKCLPSWPNYHICLHQKKKRSSPFLISQCSPVHNSSPGANLTWILLFICYKFHEFIVHQVQHPSYKLLITKYWNGQ